MPKSSLGTLSEPLEFSEQTALYQKFLGLVNQDANLERRGVNRRMGEVLLWCFLLPATVYLIAFLLLRFHFLPFSFKSSLDWITLVFPVIYTLKFFWLEVFKGLPSRFSEGGIGNVLTQADKDSAWRKNWCEKMIHQFGKDESTWRFIQSSYASDLSAFRFRTRYLTVLAGALFFLVTQGLDLFVGPGDEAILAWQNPKQFFSWLENLSAGALQLVGFGLFLILMYLSGAQTYHWLRRYLVCIELILSKRD